MRLRHYTCGFDLSVRPGVTLVVRWNGSLSVRLWDVRRQPWRIRTLVGPAFQPGYALKRRKKGA